MSTSPRSVRRIFDEIKKQDRSNTLCVDCGHNNPQWASVNNGVYFCLECAGVHRSLGVHISFVRSCSMDVWKEPQLARMRAGGNKIFIEYMRQRGIPPTTPIKEKYSSRAAEDYRARLSALAEGREPPPESGALTKMAVNTPPGGLSSSASRARRLGSASGRAALRASAPADSADDEWATWDDEPTQHASPLPSRGANTLGVLSATRMASRTPTPPTADSAATSSPMPHSKSSDWLQELEGLAISEDAVQLQSPAGGHSAQLPRGHRHTLSDSAERDGTHRHHTQQQRRRPGFEPLPTTGTSHSRTRSPQPTQLTAAELDAQRRLDAIYGAPPPSSPSPSADHAAQQSRSAALTAPSDSWSSATAPASSASSSLPASAGPRSLTNAPQEEEEEDWWTSLSRSASQTIAASTTKLGEVSSTVLNSSSNYLRESGISEKVSETSNQGWGLLSGLVDSARHLIAGDEDDDYQNAQHSGAATSYAGSTSSASTAYSSYASTASLPAPTSSLSSGGRDAGVGSASLTSSALADPSAWSTSGDSSLSSPAGVKSTGGWAEWDEDWG